MPILLYGCETWSLTLSEVHGLRMFKIMVLRKMFNTKRNTVTRDRRRLQNKELYYIYSSQNIIWVTDSRRIRWTGHVASMGERRHVYKVLVGANWGKVKVFGKSRMDNTNILHIRNWYPIVVKCQHFGPKHVRSLLYSSKL